LAFLSRELQSAWPTLSAEQWNVHVIEPANNRDLGPIPLSRLSLLRLTEVEVYGTDLGLDLGDWSDIFINTVLPMRFEWLNLRRANHRVFDETLEGSWLLIATDGPAYKVSVNGLGVESQPASPDSQARAVIEATSRDILALLLGRVPRNPLVVTGDTELVALTA
jgi:hypothetical protein